MSALAIRYGHAGGYTQLHDLYREPDAAGDIDRARTDIDRANRAAYRVVGDRRSRCGLWRWGWRRWRGRGRRSGLLCSEGSCDD